MRLPRRPVRVATLLALSALGALHVAAPGPAVPGPTAPGRTAGAAYVAAAAPTRTAGDPDPAATAPTPDAGALPVPAASSVELPALGTGVAARQATAVGHPPARVAQDAGPAPAVPAVAAGPIAVPAVAAGPVAVPAVEVEAVGAAVGEAGPVGAAVAAVTTAQAATGFGSIQAPAGGPRLYVGGPASSPSPLLPPGGHTRFGMSVSPMPGETPAAAVVRLRSQFGSLPVVRVFAPGLPPAHWDDEPTLHALGTGSAVVYSFKADPRQVAAGAYDDRVRSFLAGRPAGVSTYVAYYHEPEDDIESGVMTAADFRAATEHLAPIIRRSGAMPTTILMQYTLGAASHRDWHDYYSPAIDVLAWDAYNTSARDRVPSYRPVAALVAPVLAVAAETGKAFGWAELGSPCIWTDPTCAGRATWLASLATGLAAAGAHFATYWNRADAGGGFDYSLADTASAAAWKGSMR